MVVIDTAREHNALLEARKLGIPTICLIDTDGDPDLVDIAIPGNDDSMRSIDVVIRELCAAIVEGKQMRVEKTGDRENASGTPGSGSGMPTDPNARPGDAPAAGGQRRSRRTQFRSDEGPGATAPGAEVVAGAPDAQ
jgi:small subunit ribosomal protein S2